MSSGDHKPDPDDTAQRPPRVWRGIATWTEYSSQLSTSDITPLTTLQNDKIINFITQHFDLLFKHIPQWYAPLITTHGGLMIIANHLTSDRRRKLLQTYDFCVTLINSLRTNFFQPAPLHLEKFTFLTQLTQLTGSETLIWCILHLINPSNHASTPPSLELLQSGKIPSINDETDFAQEFFWFRYILTRYAPIRGGQLHTDLTASIAQPFISVPSSSITSSTVTRFTPYSPLRNTLVNSYAEHLYYTSFDSSMKLPILHPSVDRVTCRVDEVTRPQYIQFDDFSNIEHPILKIQPNSMSDALITQTSSFRSYFFWMFIIGDPDQFITLFNPQLQPSATTETEMTNSTTTATPELPITSNERINTSTITTLNQFYTIQSSKLNIISKYSQSVSPCLIYQLQVFNYRLYLLQSSTTQFPSIKPLPHNIDAVDLFDPLLFHIPPNIPNPQSYVLNNWMGTSFQHFAAALPQFLISLKYPPYSQELGDMFIAAWYLQHIYNHASCHSSRNYLFRIEEARNNNPSQFLQHFIEHSYDLYQRNQPTLYQHMCSRILERQDVHNIAQPRCDCFLSYLLIFPFYVFQDNYQLLQKHIILSVHGGFLNTNFSASLRNQLGNNYIDTAFDCDGFHHAVVPFVALVHTWLLVKSGLTQTFDSPIGQGASNLFYHVLSSRQYRCCNAMNRNTIFASPHLSVFKHANFAEPNPINLLPNPLSNKSNPIIAQIESIVADTDGNIWYAHCNTDLCASSASASTFPPFAQAVLANNLSPPVEKTNALLTSKNSPPQWARGVTTFQFHDPFTHTTPSDLFTLQHPRSPDHSGCDFDFFTTTLLDFLPRLIRFSNQDRPGYVPEWTDTHAIRLKGWIERNKTVLFDHARDRSIRTPELKDIHPLLFNVINRILIGPSVNYNVSIPYHRFANPSNRAENSLVMSEDNQAVLQSPRIKSLQREYQQYLNQLNHVESELIRDVLKVVLLNASAAGLFESQTNISSTGTPTTSYPFPPPPLSNQPEGVQYRRAVSKWCVEMLLVISLHIQPFAYVRHIEHKFAQTRPDRASFDPTATLSPQTISKAIDYLSSPSHQAKLHASYHIAPIDPTWLIRLNVSSGPLFMYDSLLYRIAQTTMTVYEALLSLVVQDDE